MFYDHLVQNHHRFMTISPMVAKKRSQMNTFLVVSPGHAPAPEGALTYLVLSTYRCCTDSVLVRAAARHSRAATPAAVMMTASAPRAHAVPERRSASPVTSIKFERSATPRWDDIEPS